MPLPLNHLTNAALHQLVHRVYIPGDTRAVRRRSHVILATRFCMMMGW